MSNTYTKHVHVNGSRVLKLDIHGLADGSGEETLYPIFDIADYEPFPSSKSTVYLKLKALEYALSTGMKMQLYWENTGPEGNKPILFTSNNLHEVVDWSDRGGESNADLSAPTGRILMTTQGFNATNDTFFLALCINKKRKVAGVDSARGHEPLNPQTGAGHSDGATVGTPQGVPPTGSAERT